MPAEVVHKLDLEPELPEKYREQALKQGEDPNKIQLHLDELRRMIFEKGTFKPIRTDDDYLLRFLRGRFFKPENSFKLMERYYQFREDNVELYKDVKPLSLRMIGDKDIMTVTPYRDHLGRRIMIYRFGNWKPSKQLPLVDLFRATLMIMEIGALEQTSMVCGGVGVFDFEGLTFNHILQMSPSVAQKIICLMVSCMPLRTINIHIVNNNWAFDGVYAVFKPFLSQRMKEKIYFHGKDMESLHKHIPAAHLPKKYGGQMPESNYNQWLDSFRNCEIVKEELSQLGYDVPTEGELEEFINSNRNKDDEEDEED